MIVEDLIKSIQAEKKKVMAEVYSDEGLLRLQEVMAQYSGEDRLVWSDDLLTEIKERPAVSLHPTKLPLLDALIGGFREQQLITVSAHSGHGKTAFSMFLTEQFQDLNPVVIPLEQSNEEIILQRHENGYHIPRFLSPRNLASSVTVDWIEKKIIEGISKFNTKFVVIDHLGYIDDYGENSRLKKENLAYRIEAVMKGLKNVAKRWNVIIIIAVHISQLEEQKPPTLKDLKNSSAIKQESDMVLMLWRKNRIYKKIARYENETLISVMKNRRTGKNGSIGLRFDSDTGRYVEDNSWVADMERMAEQEEQADRNFNDW